MAQSVDRALTLLGSLGDGPVTLDQAATSIGVHKSTALRLLRTLEAQGFAQRQPDLRYRLGGRLLSLAHRALEEIDVRQVAAPYLADLNARCGYTVQLAVLHDGEVLYVDEVAGHWAARPSRIGRRAPATGTAIGRVLLAGLPEDGTREGALPAELAAVRRRGWAAESAEHREPVTCVAAPVAGSGGRTVAACAVSAPVSQVRPAELTRMVPELLCTAEAISLAYGGSPTPRWCENRCGARPAGHASRTSARASAGRTR
ncbi:IclR family transcriptional regulator [Streptomyces kaniharaensis]|uniref:IclR family transcriptional regulator n=1 Tax=Streptomyces kaniharaensis TaxID=212423 RepID=A0A6N7KU38_9ACTN|nr:IclR family transcriptional regulator [Streptomyces kaniharaensis]MQS14109.1 IclR family transcriptional regulator [Streptomyces kaniharaensis]